MREDEYVNVEKKKKKRSTWRHGEEEERQQRRLSHRCEALDPGEGQDLARPATMACVSHGLIVSEI